LEQYIGVLYGLGNDAESDPQRPHTVHA
jgi:hypothetical protein